MSTAVSSAERVAEVPEFALDTTTTGLPPLDVEREFERRMRWGTTPLLREPPPEVGASSVIRRGICEDVVGATEVVAMTDALVVTDGEFGDCCCNCMAA